MKRFLTILSLVFLTVTTCFAQDDENEPNDKIRDKMGEFIRKRMGLTRTEAEKFNPIFLRYFREWRATLKEHRADKLVQRQRVIDLQIRFRNEFKEIVGEKRSTQIYEHQRIFIAELDRLKKERMGDRQIRRNRAVFQ